MSESQEIQIEPRVTVRAPLIRCRVVTDQRSSPKSDHGFTLIEILAVLLVISILAGLTIKIAIYAQRRAGVPTTKARLELITAALEAYKSDFGYCPASTITNVSANRTAEAVNAGILYEALNGNGRRYFTVMQSSVVHINPDCNCTNIFDAFGQPFSYYNSPGTALYIDQTATGVANSGYWLGGQVNKTSYDLRSYGPDTLTYPPPPYTLTVNNSGGWCWLNEWTLHRNSAADDITNWGQ